MQVLSRAVHIIMSSLCPPQWDGSANVVEMCLKCPFHLGYLILGAVAIYHREGGRSRVLCYSECCHNYSGWKLLMDRLRPGSSFNSWCNGWEWGRWQADFLCPQNVGIANKGSMMEQITSIYLLDQNLLWPEAIRRRKKVRITPGWSAEHLCCYLSSPQSTWKSSCSRDAAPPSGFSSSVPV